LYPTIRNATKIPGKIAWANASPIKDMFLNTMNEPNTPQVIPTMEEVMIARNAQGADNCSNSSSIKQN
jgi:hypothetical protein